MVSCVLHVFCHWVLTAIADRSTCTLFLVMVPKVSPDPVTCTGRSFVFSLADSVMGFDSPRPYLLVLVCIIMFGNTASSQLPR